MLGRKIDMGSRKREVKVQRKSRPNSAQGGSHVETGLQGDSSLNPCQIPAGHNGTELRAAPHTSVVEDRLTGREAVQMDLSAK